MQLFFSYELTSKFILRVEPFESSREVEQCGRGNRGCLVAAGAEELLPLS